jgi:ribosomal protein S18 acetylase RimI-like enzyme
MHYTIKFTTTPSQEEIAELCKGLETHAKQTIGKTSFEPFGFLVHDAQQNLIGGCTGVFMYGLLHIKLLWIDDSIRNKGLGTELMSKAESYAREHNCRSILVETFDWQGKDFYEKLGYEVAFSYDGFDDGYQFYFFRKNL